MAGFAGCYQLSHIRADRERYQDALNVYQPQMARYTGLVQQIRDKSKERKALLTEKKALPARKIFKHKELASKIAGLTEDLEELRSEKALLLQQFDYSEDTGADTFRKDIATLESNLQQLDEQKQRYSAELDEALKQYTELKEESADIEAANLMDARLAVREEKERVVVERVKAAYGEKYNPMMMQHSKRDVANLLHEEAEACSIRERLRQKQQQARQKRNKKKSKHHEQEK